MTDKTNKTNKTNAIGVGGATDAGDMAGATGAAAAGDMAGATGVTAADESDMVGVTAAGDMAVATGADDTTVTDVTNPDSEKHIAVFCVGNRLMLDDGIGSAVYDELMAAYDFPDQVDLYDVGCMSFDMIDLVERYDLLITVDALDGTDAQPGTVFSFAPDDMARRSGLTASLHEIKLVDLFDAAALLGYRAQGHCFGMQVENASPAELTVGLTPRVHEALPLLVDAVLAELVGCGVKVCAKATGETITSGWHHVLSE